MTEILGARFEFEEAGEFTVDLRGGNIAGDIVACFIDAPPGGLVVVGFTSGNAAVLMPQDGVLATVFNRLPLKLPFMVGARVCLKLCAREPSSGRAYAVIHMKDEVRPAPTYALGLVPQPQFSGGGFGP